MGRSTEKHCKQCGISIDNDKLILLCEKCLSTTRRNTIKEYYKNNDNWRNKQKWRGKLKLIQVNIPTKPKWNTVFNPSVTYEECSKCKELHYEDQVYYHQYMKKAYIFGLDLEDIEELLDEAKDEWKEGTTTKELIKKRGLDQHSIIKEELK